MYDGRWINPDPKKKAFENPPTPSFRWVDIALYVSILTAIVLAVAFRD